MEQTWENQKADDNKEKTVLTITCTTSEGKCIVKLLDRNTLTRREAGRKIIFCSSYIKVEGLSFLSSRGPMDWKEASFNKNKTIIVFKTREAVPWQATGAT
jgi:hypothetical protein